jgi:hypothetical protein
MEPATREAIKDENKKRFEGKIEKYRLILK